MSPEQVTGKEMNARSEVRLIIKKPTIIHRSPLHAKRDLGIYFATRRSVRKGDSPDEQGSGTHANHFGAGCFIQRNSD
jgi:hypothetical protein